MRLGRRLGFDVGLARTGVAVSSQDGIFASPIGNISELSEVTTLLEEYSPIELYVGLPLSLSGSHTKSTAMAIQFATELGALSGLPVRMIDERLTTSSAAAMMRSAGKNAKQGKATIDAASATIILEQALAIERAGNLPGVAVGDLV